MHAGNYALVFRVADSSLALERSQLPSASVKEVEMDWGWKEPCIVTDTIYDLELGTEWSPALPIRPGSSVAVHTSEFGGATKVVYIELRDDKGGVTKMLGRETQLPQTATLQFRLDNGYGPVRVRVYHRR